MCRRVSSAVDRRPSRSVRAAVVEIMPMPKEPSMFDGKNRAPRLMLPGIVRY